MYVNVLHLPILSKRSPPVYCSWDRLDLYLVLDGHAPTFPWTSSLSIIDQFSKGAHFVALQKLPTTIESAQLLTRHVFLLHPTGNHLESRASVRVRGIPGTTATSIPIQEGLFCSSFWAASPLPLLSAFDGGPCSSIDDTRMKQASGLPTAWHPSTLQVWLSSKNIQLWNVFQKLF